MATLFPEILILNELKALKIPQEVEEWSRVNLGFDEKQEQDIRQFFTNFPTIHVGFEYPPVESKLPYIGIITSGSTISTEYLGKIADYERDEITEEEHRKDGEMYIDTIMVYVATQHPIATMFLSALVWARIFGRRLILEEFGFSGIEVSRPRFLVARELFPNRVFTYEMRITGFNIWTTRRIVQTAKEVDVTVKTTSDGTEVIKIEVDS